MTEQQQNGNGGGGGDSQGQGGGRKRRRRRRRGGGGGGEGQQQGGGGQQARDGGQRNGGQRHGGQQARDGGGRGDQQGQRQGRGGRGRDRDGRKRDRGDRGDREHRIEPPKKKERPEVQEKPFKHIVRKYGVLFYETFAQAKSDLDKIQSEQAAVDQLNVVIRADGNMDDPELLAPGKTKVFAGTAWHLIHERRKQDGWYDEPR